MTRGGPFPARRRVLAAELTAGAALLAANAPAAASPSGRSEHQEPGAIPSGYLDVDPRTAVRVPLTMSLRDGVPLYPGDPPFSFDPAFQDSRTLQHDDGGYLLERITSLGTHTASHISAPVHSSSAASVWTSSTRTSR